MSRSDILPAMGTPHGLTIEQRFMRWVLKDSASGCWLWTGAKQVKWGYGVFGPVFGRSAVGAHRVSYELFVGEIPHGKHLDHLCRTPACVNPEHLEPVSPRENLLRGIGFAAVNAAKVVCISGHPFDEKNTGHYRARARACKECNRLKQRAYRLRKGA